jgi:hypothetical protein
MGFVRICRKYQGAAVGSRAARCAGRSVIRRARALRDSGLSVAANGCNRAGQGFEGRRGFVVIRGPIYGLGGPHDGAIETDFDQ